MTDDLYGRDNSPQEAGDVIKLRGCFDVALMDQDGNMIQHQHIDNVVVSAGRSFVLAMLAGTSNQSTQGFGWIEIGTSTTAPTTTDTVLNGTFQTSGGGTGRLAAASFTTSGLTSASPPSWLAQVTSSMKAWGRSIVRWMREFSLIDLDGVIPNRAEGFAY